MLPRSNNLSQGECKPYRDLPLFLDGAIKKTRILKGGLEPCRHLVGGHPLRTSFSIAGQARDLAQTYNTGYLAKVLSIMFYKIMHPGVLSQTRLASATFQ
jgi:hypothetical protein